MNTLETLTYVPDRTPVKQAFERTTHLAIGAHQDDLEIFAYNGIAECYRKNDCWFGAVTVTDGGGSARTGLFADYSDEEMKAVRHKEQNAAADIGKYSFQSQLKFPSSVVKNVCAAEPVVEKILEILKSCRPHTLYLHNPADKHPTHLAVLTHCIAALRRLLPEELPEHIYGCEVWRALDWIRDEDKIALPADKHPKLARELIEVFVSQVVGGKNYVDATLGRRSANATFYQSHVVDTCSAYTFAMDLQPLVDEPELSLEQLVQRHLDRFRSDVATAYSSLKPQ